MKKLEQIKTHVRENKKAYVIGGSAAAAGITAGLILGSRGQISISNPAMINYKPIANTVQVQMTRPGPKSFMVQCLENQQTYPSLRQAAKDLGVNVRELSEHIRGLQDSVAGLHFEKVAEL